MLRKFSIWSTSWEIFCHFGILEHFWKIKIVENQKSKDSFNNFANLKNRIDCRHFRFFQKCSRIPVAEKLSGVKFDLVFQIVRSSRIPYFKALDAEFSQRGISLSFGFPALFDKKLYYGQNRPLHNFKGFPMFGG